MATAIVRIAAKAPCIRHSAEEIASVGAVSCGTGSKNLAAGIRETIRRREDIAETRSMTALGASDRPQGDAGCNLGPAR